MTDQTAPFDLQEDTQDGASGAGQEKRGRGRPKADPIRDHLRRSTNIRHKTEKEKAGTAEPTLDELTAQNRGKLVAATNLTTNLTELDAQSLANTHAHVQNALENLDIQGRLPIFLGNAAMFRDTLAAGLPGLAQKIQTFMTATPKRHMTKNGPVNMLDPEQDMTSDQAKMALKMIDKMFPAQLPMDLEGSQAGAKAPAQVQVSIGQVGPTPDYKQLPGEVNGIQSGHAPISGSNITFTTIGPDGQSVQMTFGTAPASEKASGVVDVTPAKED